MTVARVSVPKHAKRGEMVEVRIAIQHPMETGFRMDNNGRVIPKNTISELVCRYNGVEVFRAQLHPAVSTNPFFMFYVVAGGSGEFVFTWKDDQGGIATATRSLVVA